MTEEKETLLRAIDEIRTLRRTNEILGAKVEVMELFGLTLRTRPDYSSQGMSEDIAWRMQRRVDEIDAEERNSPKPASA